MKISDDYKAKIKIWAAEAKVLPFCPSPKLPYFGVKRFKSYAEMNAWKSEMIRQIARESDGNR
jgi:hypothetical protein